MFKNVSLGVYYPGDSLLHRLQARTKLLAFFWIMVCLGVANQREWHFAPYIGVIALLLLAVALSGIALRYLWQHLWLLLLLSLISAILTALFPGSPGQPVYTFGPFPFYLVAQGALLIYAVLLVVGLILLVVPVPRFQGMRQHRRARRLRVLLLLSVPIALVFLWLIPHSAFSVGPLIIGRDGIWLAMSVYTVLLVLYTFALLLTMTTTPIALIEGISLLLAPLRWLRLPVDDFALMLLLALRFIPTFVEEVELLMKAQMARGAEFTHGALRERVQSLAALFVPLLRGALRRAAELATALEARGYEVEGRQTMLYETSLGLMDYAVCSVVLLVTVGTLIL
jgi:energy-coupling factor transport system permease protein